MDPLTITTAVAALLTFAAKTLTLLHQARADFQSADGDYNRLRDEVAAFHSLVHGLHRLAQENDRQWATDGAIAPLLQVLKPCEATFVEIQRMLDENSARRTKLGGRFRGKLVFSTQKKDFSALRAELVSQKTSIILVLQLHMIQLTPHTKEKDVGNAPDQRRHGPFSSASVLTPTASYATSIMNFNSKFALGTDQISLLDPEEVASHPCLLRSSNGAAVPNVGARLAACKVNSVGMRVDPSGGKYPLEFTTPGNNELGSHYLDSTQPQHSAYILPARPKAPRGACSVRGKGKRVDWPSNADFEIQSHPGMAAMMQGWTLKDGNIN